MQLDICAIEDLALTTTTLPPPGSREREAPLPGALSQRIRYTETQEPSDYSSKTSIVCIRNMYNMAWMHILATWNCLDGGQREIAAARCESSC